MAVERGLNAKMGVGPDSVQPSSVQAGGRAALDVARGASRLLWRRGYAVIPEFTLPDGSRLDLAGLSRSGEIVAVEIKVSLADLRGDRKWPGYLDWCERFWFAVPQGFDLDAPPVDQGLIVADRFGAEALREGPARILAPARRKSLTLAFARVAAERLMRSLDPEIDARA